jgi:serine protease AprX
MKAKSEKYWTTKESSLMSRKCENTTISQRRNHRFSHFSQMSQESFYRFLNYLLTVSLLVPLLVAARSADPLPPSNVNGQPYLATLAAQAPDEAVPVIVQKRDSSDKAEQLVLAQGGAIIRQLPLINAFAATVPAAVAQELAQSAAVRWVSLDAPVVSQNSTLPGALTVQDDFVTVAYNGSNGTAAWLSDWTEIGESDGAGNGDVAVTTFWGGALQGARFQGAGKGLTRQVDLSQAQAAQLSVSYRRKDFARESDYVALEISTNGGAAWQELTRWRGPATDSAIETATLDIGAYRTATTAIRFVTGAEMDPLARFYVDIVTIAFVPTIDATALNHQLYLPLVAGGTGNGAGSAALPVQDKHTVIAEVSAAGSCSYNCINTTALQSTYAKAINADDLWNVSPYTRGDGVTVAVVDSGISPHPDFADYWGNSRIIGRVNFTPDTLTPDDFYGHGTHVAGTIAGLGQASNQRYVGVAPEAKLVDIKVMDDWGYGTTSGVLAGLQWIYENHAAYNIKVVNLSLNSRINESYHESALSAALEVLWFNKIVVVVSAGNGGKQRLYPPANDPFVITVGAADDKGTAAISDDTLPAFSAYGMTADGFFKPDIVAPGTNIVAPLSGDDNNLTWAHPDNRLPAPDTYNYYKMSGTSMAAGVVSGAVALLLEDEPNLTPDQVKYRLQATARPFSRGESCSTGAGYLDIYNAVNGSSTQSANTNLQASQLLWTGNDPVTWGSVSWNSVSWNSVSWNSVSWNSVSWNSVSWNSVSWNSVSWNSSDFGSSNGNGSCTAAIKQVTLVDADTDRDLQPLFDGAVINIDEIGTRNLSVRVDTVGAVESVKFDLNGGSWTHIDNNVKYALAGVSNGDYTPYAFADGLHTLAITTHSADNAGGSVGAELTLQFNISGSNRCELEGTARSVSSATPMRFQLKNASNETLELFWLDYEGRRQSYQTLAPGYQVNMITYVTHPWLIARDWDNSCLHLVPDPGMESVVTITNDDLVQNLVVDGGFETGSNANWGRSTGVAVQSNNARGGGYAMRIVGDNRGLWQAVYGLKPNTTYRARAYLKGGSAGNSGYLFVRNHGGADVTTMNQSAKVNANGYTEVTLLFVTGPTATTAEIGVWRSGQGTGYLYIDDLQLSELNLRTPVVLAAVHSNKALDVAGISTSNGANVQQWNYNGGANQRWRIEPLTSGGYQLVAVHSGKCLDVSGGSTVDGANVLQWDCHSGANQQWRLEPLGGGIVQIVNVNSGKCLDVNASSTANGATIYQWSCQNGANQQWWIRPLR